MAILCWLALYTLIVTGQKIGIYKYAILCEGTVMLPMVCQDILYSRGILTSPFIGLLSNDGLVRILPIERYDLLPDCGCLHNLHDRHRRYHSNGAEHPRMGILSAMGHLSVFDLFCKQFA